MANFFRLGYNGCPSKLTYGLLSMKLPFWKDKNVVGMATILGTGLTIVTFMDYGSFFPEPTTTCTYAFRVFDANTQNPISYSKISLNYGVKLDIKQTDSEGFYQFNIPCHQDNVLTKVKIEANGYESYQRIFNALSELEEIYLNPLQQRSNISPKPSESSTEIITAVGIASPPLDIFDPIQRRENTKRTATIIARRNLREQIEVSIQAVSTVEFGTLSKDEIEIRVHGILKQSRTVSEKENLDGSFEVTVEAPLIQ